MLDHLVLATPDLAAESARQTRAGVPLVEGGPHVGAGTRNQLTGLGPGHYLELIGPDPEQPDPHGPRPFGIDALTGTRLVTWAVRVPDLEAARDAARAAGHDPGPVHPMSRRRPDGVLLSWRVAFPPDDLGGVLPFLIDWGATPHPSDGLPCAGQLDSLVLQHPDAALVQAVLDAVGPVDAGLVTVRTGPTPELTALLSDGTILR